MLLNELQLDKIFIIIQNNQKLGEVEIGLTHKKKGNKSSKLRRKNKRKSLLSQQENK